MEIYKLSKNEIRDRLLQINTGFYDESGQDYKVDNFSSFLITKGNFPSNEDISNHIKNNFKPSSIGRKNKAKGTNEKGFFKKEDLIFPEEFFNDDNFNNNFMFLGLNAAERAGKSDYSGWKNFHDIKKPTNTYRLYIQTNDSIFQGCYITDVIKSFIESDSGHVMRNFFIGDDVSFLKNEKLTSKLRVERVEKMAVAQFKDESSNVKKFFNKVNKMTNSDEWIEQINKYNDYEFKVATVESLENMIDENQKILKKSINCFIKECLAIRPQHLVVFGNDAEMILKEMSQSVLFKNTALDLSKKAKSGELFVSSEDGEPYSVDIDDPLDIFDLVSNPIEVTHYSTQSVPSIDASAEKSRGYKFKDWFEYAPKDLKEKGENALNK